jgi:hypothetical protein
MNISKSNSLVTNKYKKYGRRRWDGAVRTWKQQIHTTITGLEEVRE